MSDATTARRSPSVMSSQISPAVSAQSNADTAAHRWRVMTTPGPFERLELFFGVIPRACGGLIAGPLERLELELDKRAKIPGASCKPDCAPTM